MLSRALVRVGMPMAERGRPSLYTPDIAATICKALAEGQSLRSICRADDMPSEATVREWVIDDREGFSSQYTRARDIGLDCVAEEVFEIADNGSDHQRDRLRFDARRWYLSKLAPKRYGDKITQEHTGADGGPVQHETKLDVTGLSDDQLRALSSIRVPGK